MTFHAKKSLGQHFLFNPSTIDKILDLAHITASDHVLEIGPGPGAMTGCLAKRAGRLIAVEKDHRFAKSLGEKYPDIIVVEADFLNASLVELLSEKNKWKVVANLPYNVATEIIFYLLASRQIFHSFYLMVQKEVADRLAAKPGSKDYGVLSIMSQLYSENKIILRLAPGSFTPPPKVHSAVVSFQISEDCRYPIHDQEIFKRIVVACFGQRRKMILNPLRQLFPKLAPPQIEKLLKQAGIQGSQRPETVSIGEFAAFSNFLADL